MAFNLCLLFLNLSGEQSYADEVYMNGTIADKMHFNWSQ